jgi:shikimate kinase
MSNKKPRNIVLIGMPACGKSTIGVLLAKHLTRRFIDTDVHIQCMENKPLQEIIDTEGLDFFRRVEQRHILNMDARNAVIATGGSVVYSEAAMKKLGIDSLIIYLDLPLECIKKRLTNLCSRGVVKDKDQSLESLYYSRRPLYEKYAQITIQCEGLDHEQTLRAVIEAIE